MEDKNPLEGKTPVVIICTTKAHRNGKPCSSHQEQSITQIVNNFPWHIVPSDFLLWKVRHVIGSAKTYDIPFKEEYASPSGGYTIVCTVQSL